MSLVDSFIAQESFEGFVLDDADYSEIAFGIIIGNLDKITEFSQNFLRNLRNNEDAGRDIKIILIGKVFNIIEKKVTLSGEKERNVENFIIDEFDEATDFLASFSEFGQLLKYISSNFCSAFDLIVNKFLGNTNILKVIISAYPLIEIMGLKNNIFIYEPQELEYILNGNFDEPSRNLNLIQTAFSVISDMNLTPKELISIVAYRQFYEYLGFLVRNKEYFEYSDVQKILDCYSRHFTMNQSSKIKEVLRNLEINYSVKFQFRNEGNEERPRKNFEQKSYQSEEYDWNQGYQREGCYEAELDYSQHEIGEGRERQYEFRQFQNNDKRNYRQNSFNRRGRGRQHYRSSDRREFQVKENIKNGLRDVIVGIRDKFRENIDISVLRDLLFPFVEKDQFIVYEYLQSLSYYERHYSTQSIILWSSVCNALREIDIFNREYLDHLEYNLNYIRKNKGYQ